METSIVIQSLGLITPLGHGVAENWSALLAGRSIRSTGRVDGLVDASPDRVTALAIQAASEALAGSNWTQDQRRGDRTALIVATSKGPADRWLDERTPHITAPPSSTSDNPAGRSTLFDTSYGLATIAAHLGQFFGITGPKLTCSTACSSGLIAIIRAAMMLNDQTVDRALVVAAESSLHPLFLGSFRRLGVLAKDGDPIRPFDANRAGFHISEAAAAVCLERRQARPGEIMIDRFAQAGDAHHLTGVDPQAGALNHCLKRALDNQPVDLIHAHGTATTLNDPIELNAIEKAMEGCLMEPPTIYSHKAATGHTLGAAGLISIVLNCLMHQTGRIPGNTNTTNPLQHTRVSIPIHVGTRRVTRTLCTAAGFGGATAVISLKTK